MNRLKNEFRFIRALLALNLASAMEYRISFITQIVAMLLNNGIYFVFWIIFFNQFGSVAGYNTNEIFLLFAIVPLCFGTATLIAGNGGSFLAEAVAQGRLDYYLTLPRNVLAHVLLSRSNISAIGDILFSMCAFYLYDQHDLTSFLLLWLTAILGALVFTGFGVIAGSLAFFMGNALYASSQMTHSMMTFALYPQNFFSGSARFLLYTLLPAGFIGAVPATIVRSFSWSQLGLLLFGVVVVWTIGLTTFYVGLRRYESGSALNINV